MTRTGRAPTDLGFSYSTLSEVLASASTHARIIALTFGALMAMAVSALLIRLLLPDRIYPLYGALFFLQALYLAYFSGQGFSWPLLSVLRPATNYVSNVTVALSAAAAALFVREFAKLRLFSPRVYSIFGWLAVSFIVLAAANFLRMLGLGVPIAAIGNFMFLGSAILTIVVAFLAWLRGGNRAAGWFLIAWSLLCTFQIITAVRLLYTRADSAEGMLYYGLAPSMVAAAVLVALGVADHVRQQSLALTDAERRAHTDPLTGVLNRRSLIERLDAACMRAPGPQPADLGAVHRPRSLQADQRHLRARRPGMPAWPASSRRSGGTAPVGCHRPLRRRGIRGDPERRGRRRRAPDRRAHLPPRRRHPHRGLRQPHQPHLQHRRRRQ